MTLILKTNDKKVDARKVLGVQIDESINSLVVFEYEDRNLKNLAHTNTTSYIDLTNIKEIVIDGYSVYNKGA